MEKKQCGQALITLLIFVVVATIITSGAIIMLFVNSLTANKLQQGVTAYYIAESGVENALLRLLRDPNYSGETMAVGSGTVTVSVTGGSEKVIASSGRTGNFIRKLEARTNFNNNIFTITSWTEVN